MWFSFAGRDDNIPPIIVCDTFNLQAELYSRDCDYVNLDAFITSNSLGNYSVLKTLLKFVSYIEKTYTYTLSAVCNKLAELLANTKSIRQRREC